MEPHQDPGVNRTRATQHFSDLAANERTFLAWVRTGIGVMAFGFLVEKFNLFLEYIRLALHEKPPGNPGISGTLGFGLILLGALSIAVSTWRFACLARALKSSEAPSLSILPTVLLGVLISAVGLLLALYLRP